MASVRRHQRLRWQTEPVSTGSKIDPQLSEENSSVIQFVHLITHLLKGYCDNLIKNDNIFKES